VGNEVNLRLFTYNSSNLQDVIAVEQVAIYFLDPNNKTTTNPDGRRLVETIDGDSVTIEDTGTHLITINAETAKYTIGKYVDIWTVTLVEDEPSQTIENQFTLYPDLWYSTPTPIVFDFDFHFQPNKFRQGSKQFLIIEIIPNVPRSSDLERYYTNLAIVSDLKITIEQACGSCMPEEQDLRTIIDEESVDYRELRYGYYKLDTTDLDCGIYNVTLKLEFGDNIYISDRMPIQIYN
jgi:hypothetical protein